MELDIFGSSLLCKPRLHNTSEKHIEKVILRQIELMKIDLKNTIQEKACSVVTDVLKAFATDFFTNLKKDIESKGKKHQWGEWIQHWNPPNSSTKPPPTTDTKTPAPGAK